ncbi:MAG TPA: amidase [Candidatus Aminicenantes bacterium]|nr:amidase [Candidatus Aminicenantes bacterium]
MKEKTDVYLQKGPLLIYLTLLGAIFLLVGSALLLYFTKGVKKITTTDIAASEKIMGLHFTPQERKMLQPSLVDHRQAYESLRNYSLENAIPPAFQFNPLTSLDTTDSSPGPLDWPLDEEVELPQNKEELAFYPVTKLASLIRSRKISSLELTKLYLDRLKKYGPPLKCVVTLTEELALSQAKRADEELAQGIYRGPLHGIPWGAKDLLATKGIRTTWGATPYKDQVFQVNASVVDRLEKAGAVLVAKLSMGALAMGDVWFGGKTKNPWNPKQGSSGSSAGSAAATAAGLVGFSIGTETWGSIVSPSTRCQVSGFRPTYGRVSRYGAMALSWSMDKIGPISRTVEDCLLVFSTIYGPDGKDLSVVDVPLQWDPTLDVQSLKIGYLKKEFEHDYPGQQIHLQALETLRSLGVELIPVKLPDFPVNALSFILDAEAAAAFDELTRSNQDDLLVRQGEGAWPNIFRQARFIPAVEYIQANRFRYQLMSKMAELFKKIDVYVAPSFSEQNLLLTNLTGHPAVVVPTGFTDKGKPTSLTFTSNIFQDEKALLVAILFQEATKYHHHHPDLTVLEKRTSSPQKEMN